MSKNQPEQFKVRAMNLGNAKDVQQKNSDNLLAEFRGKLYKLLPVAEPTAKELLEESESSFFSKIYTEFNHLLLVREGTSKIGGNRIEILKILE